MTREETRVPKAEFRSYYGRPILKRPVWKQPDVPVYLFAGGAAGAAAVLAEGAALTGRSRLEHVARLTAAAGSGVGTVALIHDLGKPTRFLNMLRVVKPTSPLSIGSWILAPFGTSAAAAAASQVTGLAPTLGRLAGGVSTVFGAPLATYTGALLANTAVPIWHEAYRELPFLFAASGAAAAGGIALVAVPLDEVAPARLLGAAGALTELVVTRQMHHRLGMLAEPYTMGLAGRLSRAARAATSVGLVGSVLFSRSRVLSGISGIGLVTGSLLTRFAVFNAGLASADDPKYTVVPQRRRQQTAADGVAYAAR
jgi:formate-dependent nitrite reductase membrane component NrfD